MIEKEKYLALEHQCKKSGTTLVAVSKTKPIADIQTFYDWGQRVFGENRVQELVEKYNALPKDIQWHMIGHLQRNKVKEIIDFVTLIHSIDSERLLLHVNNEAEKTNRIVDVLLQIHIAKEESKYGWEIEDLKRFLESSQFSNCKHLRIRGIMGMATFTDDTDQVRSEFQTLASYHTKLTPYFDSQFDTISMGMTGDYPIAIEEGSTMIRVGSLLFGTRQYR